jgi:hypothetical protein
MLAGDIEFIVCLATSVTFPTFSRVIALLLTFWFVLVNVLAFKNLRNIED